MLPGVGVPFGRPAPDWPRSPLSPHPVHYRGGVTVGQIGGSRCSDEGGQIADAVIDHIRTVPPACGRRRGWRQAGGGAQRRNRLRVES